MKNQQVILAIAFNQVRQEIYTLRHSIYAQELNQHSTNSIQQLTDSLDSENTDSLRRKGFVLPPSWARTRDPMINSKCN